MFPVPQYCTMVVFLQEVRVTKNFFLQECRMILWVTHMHVISASYCEFCHINREKQRDLARNNMYDEGGCGRRVQT